MENEDPWLAQDKLHHVLFCFSLTVLFAAMANFTRRPLLRRHSIGIGAVASLLVGAAKETADELGFFRSAGASAKDAAADSLGVVIASLGLSLVKLWYRTDRDSDPARRISLV